MSACWRCGWPNDRAAEKCDRCGVHVADPVPGLATATPGQPAPGEYVPPQCRHPGRDGYGVCYTCGDEQPDGPGEGAPCGWRRCYCGKCHTPAAPLLAAQRGPASRVFSDEDIAKATGPMEPGVWWSTDGETWLKVADSWPAVAQRGRGPVAGAREVAHRATPTCGVNDRNEQDIPHSQHCDRVTAAIEAERATHAAEVARLTEQSESWRRAALAWQKWAEAVTGDATLGDRVAQEWISVAVDVLHADMETFEGLLRLARRPMKSWDSGRVIDAQFVEEETEEALSRIAALAAEVLAPPTKETE